MNYFIIVNDAQQGPYTIDELRARNITEETLVWCEGMTDWKPAWQVDELKPLFAKDGATNGPTPPPVPHATQQGAGAAGAATAGNATGEAANGNNGDGAIDDVSLNEQSGAANQPTDDNLAVKPKSHKKLYITLGIVAVILFIFALTNPGPAELRRAIDDKIGDVSMDVDDNSNTLARSIMSAFASFGKSVAVQMLKEVVDSDLSYHNYIFFSTTTVHVPVLHKDVHASTGFLGHVNAVDLSSILPDIISKQIGGGLFDDDESTDQSSTSGSSDEDQATDGSSDDDQNDNATDYGPTSYSSTKQSTSTLPSGEQVSRITKVVKQNGVTVDSATKQTTMRIANAVAREVKKEVKQQTDNESAQEANGIIDEVLGFLKSIISKL